MTARRPTDLIQVGLRLREGTRQRLWREARRRGVPINRELSDRLEASLEAGAIQSIEDAAADLVRRLKAAG